MSDEQLDLFAAAPTGRGVGVGEPERARPAARTSLAEKPSWSYYTGAHIACTEHVRRRHEGSLPNTGPIPGGRYRRRHKQTEQIMCGECAIHWRAADGMTGLPSAPNRKRR